jgi:TPR repeat protein
MKIINTKILILSLGMFIFIGCASTPIKELKPSEFIKKTPESKYLKMKTPKGLNALETGLWAYKHQYYDKSASLLAAYKNKNLAEVEHAFGFMYHSGKGLKGNYKKAVEHYRKAIKINNHPTALNNLSILYGNGQGVSRDIDKSVELLTASAKGGYVDAQFSLGKVYYMGQKVSEDYGKAYYWLQQAYHNGHARAPYTIGFMYERADGVDKNDKKALYWYNESAKRGNKFGIDAVIRLKYLMDVKSGKRKKAPSIIIH